MITAIVLAAGQSKRMGRPKMLLPWGKTTILGKVIETLQSSNINDIVGVTGGARQAVENILTLYTIRISYNENYTNGEMLSSIQTGLRAQLPEAEATLVCLGDQPQVEERSVRLVCAIFLKKRSNIVVPSYQMRRGHPWLIARPLWNELLALESPQTPRDFLNAYANEIEYASVTTPTVIEDLDTPDDYLKFKP